MPKKGRGVIVAEDPTVTFSVKVSRGIDSCVFVFSSGFDSA